jgi:hypothetical protein
MIDGRWNSYKIKHSLNNHNYYKSYKKRYGSIENSGGGENEILNASTAPGYPTNKEIEFQVPAGFEFHFLYFDIDTEIVNNTLLIKIYYNTKDQAGLKWTHLFGVATEEKKVILPFDEAAPENTNIIWTAENGNAAPSRVVNIEYYGILKALKAG